MRLCKLIISDVLTPCKVDPVNVTLSDFDGAEYHLSNLFEGESTVRTKILVSIRLRFWHELAEHGVLDVFHSEHILFRYLLALPADEERIQ